MSLILLFSHLADNFLPTISERFCGVREHAYRLRATSARERKFLRGSHFLAWVSWYSENVAHVKKMAAWWYARVWDFGYCCDFVKWRACGHENVVTREPRSRGTTILKDAASCRPCSPRKPTADEENSHHRNHPHPNPIGRGVLIHGIAHHPLGPLSGLYRTSVNLEMIEYYLVCFKEAKNFIVFMIIYIINNNLEIEESLLNPCLTV